MALDLGTLYVNIKANTADTQRNIDNVKTSLQGIKNETANTTDVMNKSFDSMGGDINKATSAVTNLMGSVKGGISSVLSGIGSITAGIPGIGAAAVIAIGEVASVIDEYKQKFQTYDKYVSDSAALIDKINTDSAVSGLSTEVVAFFTAVSDLTDVKFETISTGMANLKKAIVGANEGDESLKDAFNQLGVSLVEPDGSERPLDQIFEDVITQMQNLPAGSVTKMALAQTLFKQSSNGLAPLLDAEAGSLQSLIEEYKTAYQYVSEHDLAELQRKQDADDTLAMYEQAYGIAIAGKLAGNEALIANNQKEIVAIKGNYVLNGTISSADLARITELEAQIAEAEIKNQNLKDNFANAENDIESLQKIVELETILASEEATFWQKIKASFTHGGEIDYARKTALEEEVKKQKRVDESWQQTLDNMGVNLVVDKVSNTPNKNALDFANDPLAFAAAKHGINYSQGFAEGVESEEGTTAVEDSVEHLAATAEETLKVQTDSHSPSRLAAKYGLYWSQGFAQGILSGSDAVKAAASFVVNSATSGTNQTVNVVQNNHYNGNQNSFAAQYFSSKRLGSAIAATIRG